ncbi:MAG: hypothetical protein DRP62_05295 [Planctomycetota bacterium]|nr:MAG: hypothetical protein DRP62_05295 [Planctomycetota bacterium]
MAISKFDKWLIAENIEGDRQYIIHTHRPRFIGEILDNEVGGNDIAEFLWLDDPQKFYKDKSPDELAATLAKLMRQAGDAINEYDRILESKEHYDDED